MSAQAEQFREQGNGAFKAGEFSEANGLYDSALALLSELDLATASDAEKEAIVKCRLNKAACLLKLQGYGAAGTQAREVLAIDPSNAKAHFRLGQVAEKIGDFSAATKALTEAIKLAPSLREPRELLESIKSRLKACPRLEQALQDMALVEERALRALNYADVKRARKQMELLLKDARANKETHWEARALLGLALVCQDEGECEGAQDYIDAARRRLEAADDRRAELYCLQTDALVCIDRGEHGVALPMLEGGKRLAEEMGEGGLAARFASNLALVHTQVGAGGGPVAPASLARSIAMGEEAVGLARSRGDSHFEAVARTNLAQAYRLSRRYEECAKTLKDALVIGETLGYAHLLAAALRQFALLCLEKGRSPSRVGLAIEKLERARKIASANGLRRAACDDAYNKWAACLRYSFGTRAEAIGGLEGALAECKELGYGACRVRVLSALGLAFLRHPNGGIGSWTTSRSDVENAEEHLDAALKLAPKDTAAYGEALTNRSLAHMIRAKCEFAPSSTAVCIDDPREGDGASAPPVCGANAGGGAVRGLAAQRGLALRCAEEALMLAVADRSANESAVSAIGTCTDAPCLINLATAMLMARCHSSEEVERGLASGREPTADSAAAKAAAAKAKEALVRALSLASPAEAPEVCGRALLALAGAHEALGEVQQAAGALRKLLHMLSTPAEDGHAPPIAGEASGAGQLAAGDACSAQADHRGALASYKRTLRMAMT